MKKTISIVLCVLLVLFSFSACASDIPLDFSNTGELNVESDAGEKIAEEKVEKSDDEDSDNDENNDNDDDADDDGDESGKTDVMSLDYKALDSSEKKIYSDIIAQIKKKSAKIKLEDCSEQEFANAMRAVERDNPDYIWLLNGYTYSIEETDGKTILELEPERYGISMNEYYDMRDKTLEAVDKIVAEAQKRPKKIDQILYVHDYLINNITYDFKSLKKIDKKRTEFLSAVTAYGALINKKAVCSGYSAAFKLILNKLGVECGRTEGKSKKDGVSHEWNYFSLGGDYYYVDVTWDDNIVNGETKGRLIYDYFGITTDELLLTHTISKKQNLPVCNEDDYDYFKMNGLYFDEYDFDDIAKLIKRSDRKASFKFSSEKELKKAYKDLFGNERIFDIVGGKGSISYMISNNGLVMSIDY